MARRRKFIAPVEAVRGGWRITLDDEERNLLLRLMDELRALLTGPDHAVDCRFTGAELVDLLRAEVPA